MPMALSARAVSPGWCIAGLRPARDGSALVVLLRSGMIDGSSKRRYRLMAVAAAAMFTLLVTTELSQEDEELTVEAVLQEVLTLALLVGSTATSALLVLRVQAQEEESRL